MITRFENGQIVWLGDASPQWAKDFENQREMITGRSFQPFNGYGKVITQYETTVEVNMMVGQPFTVNDARVWRIEANELESTQNADIQKWCDENGWDFRKHISISKSE